jgi:hypothetical protein
MGLLLVSVLAACAYLSLLLVGVLATCAYMGLLLVGLTARVVLPIERIEMPHHLQYATLFALLW